MNSTDKVTYEFILSLAQKYKNVSNDQIYRLINKYLNKEGLSFSEKKTLLITEFKNINNRVIDKSKNIFNRIRINTPEELLEFLENNFEYGLTVDDEYIPLMDNDYYKNNRLLIDTSSQYLKNVYYDLPKKLKNSFNDVGICSFGSKFSLITNWHLNNYKNLIPRTIGNIPDLIELEAGFFEESNINYQRYVFTTRDISKYHSFIGYNMNDKWYYFEYILKPFRGIHEFNTKEEMEDFVYSKLLTLYVDNPFTGYTYLKDYSDNDRNNLSGARDNLTSAIYNAKIGIEYLNNEEDKSIGVDLINDGIRDYNLSSSLYKKLPNTFEFYKLKRVKKPKEGINYLEYLEWVNYQKPLDVNKKVINLFNNQMYLYKFVIKGMLEVGTFSKLDGFYTYTKLDLGDYISDEEKIISITSLLNKHSFNLAFVNPCVGRGIFILNNQGKFIEIKGVDPLLDSTKIIGSNIKRRRTLIGDNKTPYALELIEKNDCLSIRFRGACFLDELQREKKWSKELVKYNIKVPNVIDVNMLSLEYINKYNMPLLDEYLEDYLTRTKHTELINKKETNEYSRRYNKGFRVSEEIKEVTNIFRIVNIEDYINKNELDRLDLLKEYILDRDKNITSIDNYLIKYSKVLGNQVGLLLNNKYYYFEGNNRQNISVDLEINGDLFINYKHTIDKINNKIEKLKTSNKEDQVKEWEELKEIESLKYYFQIFGLSSSIKVLSYYNKDSLNNCIKVFIGSLLSTLTSEKLEEIKNYYVSITNLDELIDNIINIDDNKVFVTSEIKEYFHLLAKSLIKSLKDSNKVIEEATKIIEEREFNDLSLIIRKEDKLIMYLKKIFKEERLNYSSPKLYEELYSNEVFNNMLKEEPIINEVMNKLKNTKAKSENEYYNIARSLIREELNNSEKNNTNDNSKKNNIITFDEQGNTISYNNKELAVAGKSNTLFLFLLFSGSTCLIVGLILLIMS